MLSARRKSPTSTCSKGNMSKGPIRRAQVVTPFGVGAMTVVPDGTSLIGAGLDHWFELPDGDGSHPIDIDEFRIEEWRLQRTLGVSHFRLPPDYRRRRPGEPATNTGLTVPYLRFPTWHFCYRCHLLAEQPLTVWGRLPCWECESKKRRSRLAQVPFVAMCDFGHIQDFPWREWVHRSSNPTCTAPLRLIATGSATLSGQLVKCDCGQVKPRNLSGVTEASPDGEHTFLSDTLDDAKIPFLCPGRMPWHGSMQNTNCNRPLRGSLRSASNVYFGLVRSSVYLPRGTAGAPSDLIALLEQPPLSTLVSLLRSAHAPFNPATLRSQHGELFEEYSDGQIASALAVTTGAASSDGEVQGVEGDEEEAAFRRPEFAVLRESRDDTQLVIRTSPVAAYESALGRILNRITLIDKLRETRALYGFNRVFPDSVNGLAQRKALLWRRPPTYKDSWLPAYVVYGEGIFVELKEEPLQEWENGAAVLERVSGLKTRYENIQQTRRLPDRPITPRFILIHTLAHLVINRLTFECGYSTAAIRERLYVSNDPHSPMAALLIYTAAGDSEGTMGGLVRMGKPEHFGTTLARALGDAAWCSADPVCMEAGDSGGQGPDSCNLAACHNCALVPETACEEFNRFLDRALLIGSLANPSLGFFSRIPAVGSTAPQL
jgi:Domain of unknown function (DUF1998)